MPVPRVYKTEAIVLRQRRLGDADKVLTLFTPFLGKLEAVAKGARKPRSRLAGHVEVFTRTSLLLARGRSLDIVTQAQTVESFRSLREDLELLGRGFYVAELVDRFTELAAESRALFQLVLETLRRLAAGSPDPDLTLRYFEVRLLDELGYRPQVEACAGCGSVLQPDGNCYSAVAGGIVCPRCAPASVLSGPISATAVKVLRAFQRYPFAEVGRLRIQGELADELERCLRQHIQHNLERDLRSLAFLQTVRRHPPAPATTSRRER